MKSNEIYSLKLNLCMCYLILNTEVLGKDWHAVLYELRLLLIKAFIFLFEDRMNIFLFSKPIYTP